MAAKTASPTEALHGPDPGSWLWPQLNQPEINATQVTVPIGGHDPAAPRPLKLWRIDAKGPEPIGTTKSLADGHFDFGRLPLPQGGLSLVITPPGVNPTSVTPVQWSRPFPSPPHVVTEYDASGMSAQMIPARLGGELQILTEHDEVLVSARATTRPLRFRFDRADLLERLRLVHAFENGRRSAPVVIHDPAPPR